MGLRVFRPAGTVAALLIGVWLGLSAPAYGDVLQTVEVVEVIGVRILDASDGLVSRTLTRVAFMEGDLAVSLGPTAAERLAAASAGLLRTLQKEGAKKYLADLKADIKRLKLNPTADQLAKAMEEAATKEASEITTLIAAQVKDFNPAAPAPTTGTTAVVTSNGPPGPRPVLASTQLDTWKIVGTGTSATREASVIAKLKEKAGADSDVDGEIARIQAALTAVNSASCTVDSKKLCDVADEKVRQEAVRAVHACVGLRCFKASNAPAVFITDAAKGFKGAYSPFLMAGSLAGILERATLKDDGQIVTSPSSIGSHCIWGKEPNYSLAP